MNRDLNLANVTDTIRKLKELNLQKASMDEIRDLLFLIKDHIGTRRSYKEDTVICRTLLKKDDEIPYTNVERISYKKDTVGMGFGRASYEGNTAFYGCLNTSILKCDITSAFEVLSHSIDKKLERYHIVSGKWILQRDIDLFFIGGGTNLLYLCDEGLERNNLLLDFILKDHSNVLALKIIDSFICEEFSKVVDKDKPWEYKISACYSEILKEQGEAGLVYPSVKANGGGLNIVLFPAAVEDGLIKCTMAFSGTHYARDKNYINEYNMTGKNDNGIIRWSEKHRTHIPKKAKDFYVGLSDDKGFLDTVEYLDLGIARTIIPNK